MPVAVQIEAHHKLMYQASVAMITQQTTNPLADTVTSVPAKGEAMSAADLVAAVDYVYGEDRSRTNVESEVIGTRRWLVRPPEIKAGKYIDDEDKMDTAFDPTSTFVTALSTAVLRGCMDRILGVRKLGSVYTVSDGGILGSAIEGKRPGNAGVALPGTQIIPVGGTGLTIDKMRLAIRTLGEADFGLEEDDQLYCAINPKGRDDLLAIAQASTTPLNAFNIEQLKLGRPSDLMGIRWIYSNRIPRDAAGNWTFPIWSKKNIVEGVWMDIEADVWNDSSADNKPYCRVRTRRDVVRLEDKGVMVITATP